MNLPKTQQVLYDAICTGTTCHLMRGVHSYYFRDDTYDLCTAAASALLKKGLVEVYDDDWRGHKLRKTQPAEEEK